jgi:hypothetical protein
MAGTVGEKLEAPPGNVADKRAVSGARESGESYERFEPDGTAAKKRSCGRRSPTSIAWHGWP